MLIGPIKELREGDASEFHIDIDEDSAGPLCVTGRVIRIGDDGVHVRFESNVDQVIRRFMRRRVIPDLEAALGLNAERARIEELAGCYRDLGWTDDAIELYRTFPLKNESLDADQPHAADEVSELRTSIRRQRRALYAGFRRLLADQKRLRELNESEEAGAAVRDDDSSALGDVLVAVQRELRDVISPPGTLEAHPPPIPDRRNARHLN